MFQFGKETTVTAGGKKYTLSRLERRIVEEFRDWVREQEGDPFAAAKELLPHLDPATAKQLIADADATKKQLRAFSIGCPLAQKYLGTELGLAELVYLLLRDKQPDVTREEAFALVLEAGAAEVAKKLKETSGEAPGAKNAEPPAA